MSTQIFDLSGKNALITGGTRGIGMAITAGLANAGATVIVTGTSSSNLETALAEYREMGINASYIYGTQR